MKKAKNKSDSEKEEKEKPKVTYVGQIDPKRLASTFEAVEKWLDEQDQSEITDDEQIQQ